MHISSITIEGFGSFKKSQTIRFNHKSIIALVGQNGTGKSTILQAIAFVLCRNDNFDTSIISDDEDHAKVSVIMCNESEDSVKLGRELRKDNKEFFYIEDIKTKEHYYEYILYSMGFTNDTSFLLLDTKCLESFTMASETELCSFILQFSGIRDIMSRSNNSDVTERIIAVTKQDISTQLSSQKHEHELILKQVQHLSDYESAVDTKERFELYLKGFTKLARLLQILSDDADITRVRYFKDDADLMSLWRTFNDYEKRIQALKLAKRDIINNQCSDKQLTSDLSGCNESSSYMRSGLLLPDQGSNDTVLVQQTNSHNKETLDPYRVKQAQLIYEWCIEILSDTELGRMFEVSKNMDAEYLTNLNSTLLQKAYDEINIVHELLSSKNEDDEQQEKCMEQNQLQIYDSSSEQSSLNEQESTRNQSSLMDYQKLIDNIDIAFKHLARSFYPVLDFVIENGIDHKDYLGPLALLINRDLDQRLHSTAVRLHSEYMFAHVVSSSIIADKIISGVSRTDKNQTEEFELKFIILNEVNEDLSEYQRVSRFTKQTNNKIMKEAQRDGCEVVDSLFVPKNLNEVAITFGENVRYRYLVRPLLEYFKATEIRLKYLYQNLFGKYAVSFDRTELIRINETRRIPGITPDGRELVNSKTSFYEFALRFELIAVVNLHNFVYSLLYDEKSQISDSISIDTRIESASSDEENYYDHITNLQGELEFLKCVRDNLANPEFLEFNGIVASAKGDVTSENYSSQCGRMHNLTGLAGFLTSKDVRWIDDKSFDPCDGHIVTQNPSLNHGEALKADTDSHHEENSAHEKILGINAEIRNEESGYIKVVSRIAEINDILMECKSVDAAIQRRWPKIEDQCSQKWAQCREFIFAPNSQNAQRLIIFARSAVRGRSFLEEELKYLNLELVKLKDIIDTDLPQHSIPDHHKLYEKYLSRLESINEFFKSDWMVDYANMKLVESIKSRKEIFFAKLQSNFEIIFGKLTGITGSLKLKRNAENEIVGISFDVSPENVINTVDLPTGSIYQQILDQNNAYGTLSSRRGARYRRSVSRQRNKRKRITRKKFMRYLPPVLKEKLMENAVNKGNQKQSYNKQYQGHSKEHRLLNTADDILEKENVEETSIHEDPQLPGSNDIFPDNSSDQDYDPNSDNNNGHKKGNNMINNHELIDLPIVGHDINPCAIALSYEQKRAASLALLLSLHVNHTFKVFLLDEIDAELDPVLRVRLANTIKELSMVYKNQYIISTHFRIILNVADKFYNVSRERLYSGENGTTSVAQRISKDGALIINKDEDLITHHNYY